MIDMAAIRARAAELAASWARDEAANAANAAKRLMPEPPISQLATLATTEKAPEPQSAAQREADGRLDAAEEARQERAAVFEFDAGMTVHDAEEAAGIKPWTEQEQTLQAWRMGRAYGLGVEGGRAERLAARLVQRDRDGDDRRLCIECQWARINDCAKGEAFLVDVLQRCPRFQIKPHPLPARPSVQSLSMPDP